MKRCRPTEKTATKMPKLEKPGITQIIYLDEADDNGGSGAGGSDNGFLNKQPTMLLKGSTKEDPICVEHYTFIDEDIRMFSFKPQNIVFGKRSTSEKPTLFIDSVTAQGESSNSRDQRFFVCEICTETRDIVVEWFPIKGCPHAYCTHCVVQYVSSKLEQNLTDIRCPVSGCTTGSLDPEHCRAVLPPEMFDRWGIALCEAAILEKQKFYCPYKDCSAMLIDDGGEVVRESQCPNCIRMFCAQCKVPWHSGIDCEEFQKLHKDETEKEDMLLLKLAGDHQWCRCPSCGIHVEKIEGCSVVTCR
ncbi:hypothetical protein Tsubulata_005127 [Turnera subulata]|uniref:RBR-type E3 ubiquitin transferase n=1 Tax=Turnera subulata TaxID=218843 RepID=A0A9Q0JCQ1_9ROSI|nr:hypothetical protein Tsubulata_005127 [Turnera subulata]